MSKLEEKKIIDLDFNIKKIRQEIWDMNNEISKEEKRIEKSNNYKNDLIKELHSELLRLNAELDY